MRRLQTLSNIAFSPDGERVAYSTDASGQYNLWTQSVRGGWPSQLTTFEDRTVRWIRWLPSGDILFFADREGDEKYQLYRVPERGGWPERVTRDDHAQHFPGDLSRDGRLYSLSGNERSTADMDVMLYDTATGQTRVALAADGWFNGGWWSPDGRHLAVTQLVSNSDHHVHVLDVVSGEHRDLTPHDGEEHNSRSASTAAGRASTSSRTVAVAMPGSASCAAARASRSRSGEANGMSRRARSPTRASASPGA